MNKVLLSFLLALFSMIANAYVDYTTVDGIKYKYDTLTKQAEVTSNSYNQKSIVIPSTVIISSDTYTVTGIGDSAFSGCSSLTTITLPNSITKIGDYVFEGCTGLTSITIPKSVTSIGWCTFRNCTGLTSMTIPYSVISIGGGTFSGCSNLKKVILNNNSMVSQSNSSSWDISSIFGSQVNEYILGDSIKAIGSYTFANCKKLHSVVIPNSVVSIGRSAFEGCNSLTNVSIKDLGAWCNILFAGDYSNPLYYAHHLYLNNVEVKELVIPESVFSINDYSFYSCDNLTSVTIPKNVTTIFL